MFKKKLHCHHGLTVKLYQNLVMTYCYGNLGVSLYGMLSFDLTYN